VSKQNVYLLVDLGFGDQGKGSIVDALARKTGAHTVVRFHGGPQAGHGVTTPDGRHHIFAQFGSASFIPGVQTFLSRFMLIDPWRMLVEAKQLAKQGVVNVLGRTLISENALIITPFHAAANRLRELARGQNRHGSCGLGIGETVKDSFELPAHYVLRANALRGASVQERSFSLRKKLRYIQHFKREQLSQEGVIAQCWCMPEAKADLDLLLISQVAENLVDNLTKLFERVRIVADNMLGKILARDGTVIFEPAQGVLLDEWRGFHPYTTWSTCTLANADTLLKEQDFDGRVHRIGILRAYATRHGPGPFPTEDQGLTSRLPDPPSARNEWQGQFRVGWFDCVLTRYAMACCGELDSLAITCLDRLRSEPDWKVCMWYQMNDTHHNNLLLGPFGDLSYQEKLGQDLLSVTPLLTSVGNISPPTSRASFFEDRVEAFTTFINQQLDCPISILSLGPRATDKRFLLGDE